MAPLCIHRSTSNAFIKISCLYINGPWILKVKDHLIHHFNPDLNTRIVKFFLFEKKKHIGLKKKIKWVTV